MYEVQTPRGPLRVEAQYVHHAQRLLERAFSRIGGTHGITSEMLGMICDFACDEGNEEAIKRNSYRVMWHLRNEVLIRYQSPADIQRFTVEGAFDPFTPKYREIRHDMVRYLSEYPNPRYSAVASKYNSSSVFKRVLNDLKAAQMVDVSGRGKKKRIVALNLENA